MENGIHSNSPQKSSSHANKSESQHHTQPHQPRQIRFSSDVIDAEERAHHNNVNGRPLVAEDTGPDNPFRPDGELFKLVDPIVQHWKHNLYLSQHHVPSEAETTGISVTDSSQTEKELSTQLVPKSLSSPNNKSSKNVKSPSKSSKSSKSMSAQCSPTSTSPSYPPSSGLAKDPSHPLAADESSLLSPGSTQQQLVKQTRCCRPM